MHINQICLLYGYGDEMYLKLEELLKSPVLDLVVNKPSLVVFGHAVLFFCS